MHKFAYQLLKPTNSASAEMTFPKVVSDLLIFAPSCKQRDKNKNKKKSNCMSLLHIDKHALIHFYEHIIGCDSKGC